MRSTAFALGLVALCLAGLATADGDAEPVEAPRPARFTICRVKEGTMLLDTATGHTWRLEFQDKAGYTWSQVPRGTMRDPDFEIPSPGTGGGVPLIGQADGRR